MASIASQRIDLTRLPALRGLLRSRTVLFILRALTLLGFWFAIFAGLFGSQVGSHNFAIIIVWIAWWTVLKLVLIPIGGRSWCSVCPIPAPGEWLQQGSLLRRAGRGLGFNLPWPKKLRTSWIQTGGFLAIGLFSALTLTRPNITAWVFIGLFVLALATSLVFERRSFCRYICPMGGFIGWYAQAAPLEVRVRDQAVCAAHSPKTCYTGCAEAYGCPWMNFPAALKQNNPCGLCMECLRACPHDNMAVNLRPFGADLSAPSGRRLDEAWLGLSFLGSVATYAAVFLGPWGNLKSAAYAIGSTGWWVFAGGFLFLAALLIPALLLAATWFGKRWSGSGVPLKKIFVDQAYALLPVGFSAWIGFTISFAFAKLSYILPVLSDPLGWGWDLFGTALRPNAPFLPEATPVLVVLVLAGGLLWAGKLVLQTARKSAGSRVAWKQALPVLAVAVAFTTGMLALLVG